MERGEGNNSIEPMEEMISEEEMESRRAVNELAEYLYNEEDDEQTKHLLMEYFTENSDDHTNGKFEIITENTNYNKLKIIKAIEKGMVKKTKKLKGLKWKNVSGVKPTHFAEEYRNYRLSQGFRGDDDSEDYFRGTHPPQPTENNIRYEEIENSQVIPEIVEDSDDETTTQLDRFSITSDERNARWEEFLTDFRAMRGSNPESQGSDTNEQSQVIEDWDREIEEMERQQREQNELDQMQQNEPIQEIEDWDREIEEMERQQREEQKRQDWLRRQMELRERMWSGIESKEKDMHGDIVVEEINENTRRIGNNVYDYKKGRWYVRIRRGRNFGNLKLISTNPDIDPPRMSCYNCWQHNHRATNCPKPPRKFCSNCGRRGREVEACERCGDRFREMEID